ncbi:anaerobic sulfatase maturase [Tessaracoccus sp. OS52]|uniref:anaerobic sulfatase maturase n=1 Tax=Tessaracoccus sp. OS52 TaxID=2886691 RepID=UPI001D129CAF|nr:anaerobic sulfatase maturase [Tessaracoccus sp. OS52]MCC2593686.1 anaerobic sulfatase maturase [Tessaracoccus sp. OS52]
MQRNLPFSVVTKPTGAACNLDCTYCFFLSKELLYDADSQRMSAETLHAYIANQLDSHPDGDVTLMWQGGEPTMRGLAFYREAVRLGNELKRPGQRVTHAMQTNGTLLDDDWCAFLHDEGFLVGLSIDGPAALHDSYRVNKAGRGTHAQVIRGWEYLRKHDVETNILCTVNAANADHGAEVYRYFRDDLGATFLQFIPIVERVPAEDLATAEQGWIGPDGARLLYRQVGDAVTSRSVAPAQWGRFLNQVFDEWVRTDVGKVYVQHFDVMLAARFGQYSLCVHAPECGTALAVEHNGDIYSCDHFVEPGYELGNVRTNAFADVLTSPQQREFGRSKRTGLTDQCRRCPVRWACNGGCPKDRFAVSVDGQEGQNYLCEGYFNFFSHAAPTIEEMAMLLQSGRAPAEVMER